MNYEEYYEISSHGNIRAKERLLFSNRSKKGDTWIRKPMPKAKTTDTYGYFAVYFFVNNKAKTCKIHRLVAQVFCEKRDGCEIVNHIDGDKKNNYYKNLEWVTDLENKEHAKSMGLLAYGNRCAQSKLTDSQVLNLRLEGKYTTYIELAKKYNVSVSTIYSALKGISWKHV